VNGYKSKYKFSFNRFFLFLFHLRFVFSLLLAALCPLPSHAQIIDSIKLSLHKKPKLVGGFGTKNTFIDGFNAPVFSARIGAEFNHHIRFGGGINWLKLPDYEAGRDNTPFYLQKIIIDSTGKADTLHPALKLSYFNYYVEYIFYRTRHWQFSIPIQFGMGGSSYEYNYRGERSEENKHFIFLYEPAVSGHYKVLKWFGLGVDVGYRFLLINNKKIGSRFNSPVYDLKAMIFPVPLYKAIFPKTKLARPD